MPFTAKKPKAIDTTSLNTLGDSVKDLAKYTEREFTQVASSMQATESEHIWNSAPPKPRRGTIAYADGVHWNPGAGEGVYSFNGTVWIPLFGPAPGVSPGAGVVGQLISAATSGGLVSATPANTGSLVLPSGVWDIEAYNQFGGPGATTSTDWNTVISTVAASISSGVLAAAHSRQPSSADMYVWHVIPRTRVTIAANTTYYLNAQATYSGSSYSCSGAIFGVRVS